MSKQMTVVQNLVALDAPETEALATALENLGDMLADPGYGDSYCGMRDADLRGFGADLRTIAGWVRTMIAAANGHPDLASLTLMFEDVNG